ncbi:hypothetical protein [Dehalogenimonas formicexedens]|uniref:hypothetical protein n=1 Tax=Dehalogenimonas formicexedens TaxID=1839801 RepID=UPI001313E9A3|nr:hypothetical protein [Dehalogenimonas formicexedens]
MKERGKTPDQSSMPESRHIRVVNHYPWTGLPFTVLLPRIIEISRAWGLRRLAADVTGLGAPLCASLKQSMGHRIVSFVFTTSSKSALGYELLAAAGTGRLSLYARDASAECDEAWRELESAQADYKPNRTLNFYVAPGARPRRLPDVVGAHRRGRGQV